MTIDEAIEILEKWCGGGYATRIDVIDPAINLGIASLTVIKKQRKYEAGPEVKLLPGETKD